jgi:two-component system sensor histidine kinase and response regulator WspE
MKKILIVDDSEGVRTALDELLKKTYEVGVASDGVEAHRLLHSARVGGAPFDLIMTDVNMPKMGGIELVDLVKATMPGMPCILMGAGNEPPSHRADLYLQKPPSVEYMMKVVTKLLSQSADTIPSIPRS